MIGLVYTQIVDLVADVLIQYSGVDIFFAFYIIKVKLHVCWCTRENPTTTALFIPFQAMSKYSVLL